MNQEFVEKIKRDFEECVTAKPGTWVILYNELPLKLRSGKHAWKTQGHAKNALHNHLYFVKQQYNRSQRSSSDWIETVDIDYLINNGIVEFRQLL